MKLLRSHDNNFDLCRTFLLISMIFTHSFGQFYIPDYDRNLTNYVTIGFVFLSGFTIGTIYFERVRNNPQLYFRRTITRVFKLFLIFIMGNLIIIVFSKSKIQFLYHTSILKRSISIFLGTNQPFYSFDILIPIATTTLFSWFILKYFDRYMSLLFIIAFYLFIYFTETRNILNFYGIKYLLSGLIGCLIGRLMNNLDWDRVLKILSQNYAIICFGSIILLYYLILNYRPLKGDLQVHYHLIPTIIILLFVYLISYHFQLNKNQRFKILNETLSIQLLFSYLYHLLLIHILFLFFPKDSLDLIGTLLVVFFLISICIVTCLFIDFLSAKSIVLKKIYLYIFKV